MPFLCCFLIAGLCVGLCSAATDKNEVVPEEGPDVAVIDASVKMDISDMGDIPLGTIPDERLIVTITVKNLGNREAPGYKLRAYLVRVGREDEIGTQIGGDITDIRLGAGEARTYVKSWSMPTHLKKGQYRVMIVADTSNYFVEPDTDNNRIISQQPVSPGALTGPEGAIPVYSPAVIEKPGYYVLKRDIDGRKMTNVFEIKSSGVTFDGGGNTIRGSSTGFNTGIYINAGAALRDITIKNVAVEGVDAGIWMYKVSNSVITDCTFTNNANMGIRLDQSNQNQVFTNVFERNGIGIGVFQSKDNVIYNNLFKNQHNAVVNEDQKNVWNTDLKGGTNIIGGSTLGGNAWFDESGEGGFSAVAQDYTHDGISDAPYALNANNIDLYPLAKESSQSPKNMLPVPSETPSLLQENTSPEDNRSTHDAPGENATLDLSSTAIDSTPDSVDTRSETVDGENKNTTPSSPLSPYADISVQEIYGPERGCPGAAFNVSAVIKNTGGYDADAFQVRFYLTEDRQIDGNDLFLGEKTVKNLKAGTEQILTETFVIPPSIGLKNYYLAIVTNTDNSVFEEKKVNNTGYSSTRMAIREC